MCKIIKRKQKMIVQIQSFNLTMNSINSFKMSMYTNQSLNNNNNKTDS